ncbi:copper resistance protein CopC [Microbacterium sp. CFH 31415]|uniref:copper resistance CopC family protein n=1 Tax=Microbacterium sp. CFH 31415 TaxID=2921732 RepID=UPI001F13ADD4|nr:copper resistance CopC family protein [Microbacterium sp. CFH 31415]MCH6229840.1 copper resistance protein CopC [Microbacterium sp. CFH 31415]
MSQGIHTALPARVLALAAALLVAFALLLVPASPAHAHDELIGSTPSVGSTVEGVPAQLTLTFSGAIATDAGASDVAVTDAAGTSLIDGAPTAQDNVLTQPLTGEASGEITVLWKVVSSDGHPISGQFAFTVTSGPTPTPTDTATPTPTPTETSEPTQEPSATPSATVPADSGTTGSDVWPWVLIGIVVIALGGGITYLLVSRARRQKALADNRARALGGGPRLDSDASAER